MTSAVDEQDTVSSNEAPADWRLHFQWLVLCAAIIVGAALLELRQSGLSLPGFPGYVLPGMCVTRTVFHVNCPGCGMTRSFVAMAHGQVRRAFGLHRLGPILFLIVLAQIPLRAYAILAGGLPGLLRSSRLGTWIGGWLVVALFANWLYNVITGAAFCAP